MRSTEREKTGRRKRLPRLILILAEALLLVFILLWRTGTTGEPGILPLETQKTAGGAAYLPATEAESGAAEASPTPKPADYSEEAAALRITEVMAKNNAALMAEDGSFPDWFELTNFSEKEISLKGWAFSDGGDPWPLPNRTIGAGECLLIYAGAECGLSADFALSEGEELTLLDPNGDEADSLWLDREDGDVALARVAEGSFELTKVVTPGFPNTREGYEAFEDSLPLPESPLIISEVCTANHDDRQNPGGVHPDWVELCNRSSAPVRLSDYFLSNKASDRFLFLMPEKELYPGEYIVIWCSRDFAGEEKARESLHAPFSLESETEHLWLTRVDGRAADGVAIRNMPVNGSFGREEGRNGWFYFEQNTPGMKNTGGCRWIAEKPQASVAPGQYDDTKELLVELSDPSGRGTVWFTTEGDLSQGSLTRYTEPVRITETTILRAVTLEDGACRSSASVFSYFLNEKHTFPVISLVSDNWYEFRVLNDSGDNSSECAGTVALIEGSRELFCQPCSIRQEDDTVVFGMVKMNNYGLRFCDCYGSQGITGQDLFGDGVLSFTALLLRNGQDWGYEGACMRSKIVEELCRGVSPDMPFRGSRYCVLYINGEYKGICPLQENMNEAFFSSAHGVSEESVEVIRGKPDYKHPLNDIIEFCRFSDMSDPKNYAKFCSDFDIDNLIDYLVIQSYSGNTDLYNSIGFYHSTEEDGGKWKMVFFDQDKTFYRPEGAVKAVFSSYGKSSQRLTDMAQSLCRNPEFRSRLLARYAEALKTTLSDENVLRVINELTQQLAPEIARDRERYGLTTAEWKNEVNRLRGYFREEYSQSVIQNLCEDLNLSAEEKDKYFSELIR